MTLTPALLVGTGALPVHAVGWAVPHLGLVSFFERTLEPYYGNAPLEECIGRKEDILEGVLGFVLSSDRPILL